MRCDRLALLTAAAALLATEVAALSRQEVMERCGHGLVTFTNVDDVTDRAHGYLIDDMGNVVTTQDLYNNGTYRVSIIGPDGRAVAVADDLTVNTEIGRSMALATLTLPVGFAAPRCREIKASMAEVSQAHLVFNPPEGAGPTALTQLAWQSGTGYVLRSLDRYVPRGTPAFDGNGRLIGLLPSAAAPIANTDSVFPLAPFRTHVDELRLRADVTVHGETPRFLVHVSHANGEDAAVAAAGEPLHPHIERVFRKPVLGRYAKVPDRPADFHTQLDAILEAALNNGDHSPDALLSLVQTAIATGVQSSKAMESAYVLKRLNAKSLLALSVRSNTADDAYDINGIFASIDLSAGDIPFVEEVHFVTAQVAVRHDRTFDLHRAATDLYYDVAKRWRRLQATRVVFIPCIELQGVDFSLLAYYAPYYLSRSLSNSWQSEREVHGVGDCTQAVGDGSPTAGSWRDLEERHLYEMWDHLSGAPDILIRARTHRVGDPSDDDALSIEFHVFYSRPWLSPMAYEGRRTHPNTLRFGGAEVVEEVMDDLAAAIVDDFERLLDASN